MPLALCLKLHWRPPIRAALASWQYTWSPEVCGWAEILSVFCPDLLRSYCLFRTPPHKSPWLISLSSSGPQFSLHSVLLSLSCPEVVSLLWISAVRKDRGVPTGIFVQQNEGELIELRTSKDWIVCECVCAWGRGDAERKYKLSSQKLICHTFVVLCNYHPRKKR